MAAREWLFPGGQGDRSIKSFVSGLYKTVLRVYSMSSVLMRSLETKPGSSMGKACPPFSPLTYLPGPPGNTYFLTAITGQDLLVSDRGETPGRGRSPEQLLHLLGLSTPHQPRVGWGTAGSQPAIPSAPSEELKIYDQSSPGPPAGGHRTSPCLPCRAAVPEAPHPG